MHNYKIVSITDAIAHFQITLEKLIKLVHIKLEEIGKMLGGWKKSLNNPEKKNRAI